MTPELSPADRLRPFPGNPLSSRGEWQRALIQLVEPLDAWNRSPEGVWAPGTTYDVDAARLEVTVRPMWGLAALESGGGRFEGWGSLRSAVAAGTDPDSPAFWGLPRNRDQRLVEASVV